MLSAVLELDYLCFGGLWTLEGYQRELDSPNSVLLGLFLEDSREAQVESGSTSRFAPLGEGERELHKDSLDLQVTLSPSHPLTLSPSHPLTPHPSPLISMGCFWAILDEAHITLLGVHPHYQRQGLGQAMLLGLMAEAYERRLERATLEVRVSNQSALSLYKKFGFQIAGRRRCYYKDTNEDALILWCGNLQQPEFQSTLATWYKSVSDRLTASEWNLHLPQIIHHS